MLNAGSLLRKVELTPEVAIELLGAIQDAEHGTPLINYLSEHLVKMQDRRLNSGSTDLNDTFLFQELTYVSALLREMARLEFRDEKILETVRTSYLALENSSTLRGLWVKMPEHLVTVISNLAALDSNGDGEGLLQIIDEVNLLGVLREKSKKEASTIVASL